MNTQSVEERRCDQGVDFSPLPRYNAYMGIGYLSVATGPEIQNYLRNVLTSIKQCLPAKEASSGRKRQTSMDPALFACISMLARAVKHR